MAYHRDNPLVLHSDLVAMLTAWDTSGLVATAEKGGSWEALAHLRAIEGLNLAPERFHDDPDTLRSYRVLGDLLYKREEERPLERVTQEQIDALMALADGYTPTNPERALDMVNCYLVLSGLKGYQAPWAHTEPAILESYAALQNIIGKD